MFHIETSKSNDWFLYEMQHWCEMGQSSVFIDDFEHAFDCVVCTETCFTKAMSVQILLKLSEYATNMYKMYF